MRSLLRPVAELSQRVRRYRLLGSVAIQARLRRAVVTVNIAPDVQVGRNVRIVVQGGTRNSIVIGRGGRLLDGVLIHLKGADLYFGERVEIRRGTVLNLSGAFSCLGRNVLSYSNVVHCAEAITLDLYASTNEFVSLIDSTHHHDGPHEFFYENTSSAPIFIGKNAWICNKASVLMGVTIGNNAVVASHAVANRDVPEAAVAAGTPARVVADRAVAGGALRFATAGDRDPQAAAP